MSAGREYVRATGLDVATWVVIGLAVAYLGYRIGPTLVQRFLLWTS